MINVPVPYNKLHTFSQWLGLTEDELRKLAPVRDFFIKRKNDFAGYFYDFFMNIPEAKLIIEHERTQGHLLQAWANWFELFFTKGLNDEFLGYLWTVGAKHVEINLDKRFSNMGFSLVRQFCQEGVRSELPPEKAIEVLRVIDKMVDFCLLVETDAYLTTTTRCDAEIIKGVADRIRNPVVVIGGNIKRLMKHIDVKDPLYQVYDFIFSQSNKCDHMVRDIKTYMEVFEREPVFVQISIKDLLHEVLEGLFAGGRYARPRIEMDLTPSATHIFADRSDMQALFVHLLENSLEALAEKDPLIRISSDLESASPHSLNIVIFNTGVPIIEDDMERLFSSFFTTKPAGTGFGLAIARQAARKNMGRLWLEPVKGEGTKALLSLPCYEGAT